MGKNRVDKAVFRDSSKLRAKDNQSGNDVPNATRENYEADDTYHLPTQDHVALSELVDEVEFQTLVLHNVNPLLY